jgi:hypothetical protein
MALRPCLRAPHFMGPPDFEGAHELWTRKHSPRAPGNISL